MGRVWRMVRWWYQGWQRFGAVAGGDAQTWVGPNPWKRAP